jgi:hypothetical protein
LSKKSDENAYLVLGCYGRIEDDFVLCPSTENRILKLDESLINFEGVVDYLESVKLFDRPMLDYNALRHLVYNLQDRFDQKVRRLWTERYYNLIERYIVMHKPCGLYARLIIINESQEEPKAEESHSFVIKGVGTNCIQNFTKQNLSNTLESQEEFFESSPKIHLIRNRRV